MGLWREFCISRSRQEKYNFSLNREKALSFRKEFVKVSAQNCTSFSSKVQKNKTYKNFLPATRVIISPLESTGVIADDLLGIITPLERNGVTSSSHYHASSLQLTSPFCQVETECPLKPLSGLARAKGGSPALVRTKGPRTMKSRKATQSMAFILWS